MIQQVLPARVAANLQHFAEWRVIQPIRQDPATGIWHVYRYADVVRVLTAGAYFGGAASAAGPGQLACAARRHQIARALLRQALAPPGVGALAPYVAQTVQRVLAPALPTGRLEVMADLAQPLTRTVFAAALGVPPADRPRVIALLDSADPDPLHDGGGLTGATYLTEGAAPPVGELAAYFAGLATRPAPGAPGDLLRRLREVEVDSRQPTAGELGAACALLLRAGPPPVAALVGNAVLCLSGQPETLARLRHAPPPVYSTVEEILRYLPPVWHAVRITREAAALGETVLPAGAVVHAWIAAANHDPDQFATPARFDIERIPNRHVSFGDDGTFYCLGAGLARLVARLTLAALAHHICDFELAPGDAVEVASPAEPEEYGGDERAIGAGDRPVLRAHPPGGNPTLPAGCSLTKLAIVFAARV